MRSNIRLGGVPEQEAPATMCAERGEREFLQATLLRLAALQNMQQAGTQKWLRCVPPSLGVWWEECAGLEPRWWSGRKPQSENRGGRGPGHVQHRSKMGGASAHNKVLWWQMEVFDKPWRTWVVECLCVAENQGQSREFRNHIIGKTKIIMQRSSKHKRYVAQPKPALIRFGGVTDANSQMCLTSWQNRGNSWNIMHQTKHTDTLVRVGGKMRMRKRGCCFQIVSSSWSRHMGGCCRLGRCLKSVDVRSMSQRGSKLTMIEPFADTKSWLAENTLGQEQGNCG